MKNLTVALALVAVLAMVGTTFAGLEISVSEGVDLGNGLTEYVVSTKGVNSYSGVVLDGVHQAFSDPYNSGSPTQTPYIDSFNPFQPNAEALKAADTYLMFTAGDISQPSESLSETLGTGSPLGAPTGGAYGVGTFGSVGCDFAFLGGDESTFRELLHVVIPTGATALMTGNAADGQGVGYAINEVIGVPEPSTILMLVAGGLCLLAVRRRK